MAQYYETMRLRVPLDDIHHDIRNGTKRKWRNQEYLHNELIMTILLFMGCAIASSHARDLQLDDALHLKPEYTFYYTLCLPIMLGLTVW